MIRPFSSTVFAVEHDNKENVQEWHSLFPGFMIVGTTDRKKARKIAWGLRREGEVLASFFCSFTLTESLVQAISGINVAQPRSHSARGASHVIKLVLWRQTFIFFLR